MEYLLKSFYPAVFFLLLFFAASCSPGVYLFEPQIDTPLQVFENNNNIIFKVIDERKINSHTVTGYENRVFQYTIPIEEYVETYFNNSLEKKSDDALPEIVTVYIDQLRYDDPVSLKYSFRFSEPVAEDTNFIFRISAKYFNEDVRIANPKTFMNYALTHCLESFFSYDNEFAGIYVAKQENSIDEGEIVKDEFLLKADENPDSNIVHPGTEIKSSVREVQIGTTYVQKITLRSIAVSYFAGDKITGGIHLYYTTGQFNKEGQNIFGYGLGLLYYDILNNRDGFDGFMFSFTAPLHFTHYFSGYEDGLFIGSALKIAIGNEGIDYGYKEETYFFFGPTLEPFIGVKFSNAVSLDAGGYLLALFGSRMLPDDYGMRFNINIWF